MNPKHICALCPLDLVLTVKLILINFIVPRGVRRILVLSNAIQTSPMRLVYIEFGLGNLEARLTPVLSILFSMVSWVR